MIPKRDRHRRWPEILTPANGCMSPIAPIRQDERVLHIALYPTYDVIPALPNAFKTISTDFRQVDYLGEGSNLPNALYEAASEIRPTIVFAQIQQASLLSPGVISRLRELCDTSCVIAQFDGDLHHRPNDPARDWFVELGRCIDTSLTVETEYQEEYLAMGVRHPGYLQIGTADGWDRLRCPTPSPAPRIVLLGQRIEGYKSRCDAVSLLQSNYGPDGFGVYGTGWDDYVCGRPYATPGQELWLYAVARAALSVSCRNDVSRYTSDRLMRMLYAGAIPVVERFRDCDALGIVDGDTAFLWSGMEELKEAVNRALSLSAFDEVEMRGKVHELGMLNTWSAHMPELLAIVDAVRSVRAS